MDAKVADEVKKHFSTAEGTISLTGGAKKWICIPCKKTITGSATKLRAHLLTIYKSSLPRCCSCSAGPQFINSGCRSGTCSPTSEGPGPRSGSGQVQVQTTMHLIFYICRPTKRQDMLHSKSESDIQNSMLLCLNHGH